MQQYMEHEWPRLYKQVHNADLVCRGMVRLPSNERVHYVTLCAQAVLYYEHRSPLADNPHLGQT